MKGDIALAGFVLTAEEWEEMDVASRTQLLAASQSDLVVRFFAPLSGNGQSVQAEGGNSDA